MRSPQTDVPHTPSRVKKRRQGVKPSAVDIGAFSTLAVPLVRDFVFDNYEEYAMSKLTFRDMKESLTGPLQMSYEQLKQDELSAVIEDAVDLISNTCDGGKLALETCKERTAQLL